MKSTIRVMTILVMIFFTGLALGALQVHVPDRRKGESSPAA
jgi:hypothetical protein